MQVRERIRAELKKAFEGVSLIATPTTPTPAFKIGEKVNDPVSMYLSDIFSAPANLSRACRRSRCPSGKTDEGLPLSIQFMASHWDEDALFRGRQEIRSDPLAGGRAII
ncbi:MAG: amidase family protein [bacterium]